jgi:hypothetical protein
MSDIVLVCRTTTSIVDTRGQPPRVEMTPRVGVYAQSALFHAGARPDDQDSSPKTERTQRRRRRRARPVRRAGSERSEESSVIRAFGASVGERCMPPSARVMLSEEVGERRTTRGGSQAACKVAVLGGVGNAVQRPKGLAACPPGVGRLGVGAGPRGSARRPRPAGSLHCRRQQCAPSSQRAIRPRLPDRNRGLDAGRRRTLRRRRTARSQFVRMSRTRAGWPPVGSAPTP